MQPKTATTGTSGTRIKSVMDLIGTQITLPRAMGAQASDPDVVAYSPLNDTSKLNDLLPKLFDKTTVQQAIEMVPRINVNTAPREVLMGIPGMTETLADSIIISHVRQTRFRPIRARFRPRGW